ncbi:MAG: rod shape-determining protein MreC [Deltaproteobacteria bacterium]|nr:rod shape-determining protein MreC [Deltaproteobacteria bacterium]
MARPVENRVKIGGASLALFCLSLFLTSYSSKNQNIGAMGGAAVQQVLHPFQALTHSIYSSVSGVWDSYISLVGVREDNAHLRSRIEALEVRNAQLQEVAHENERLRNLLNVTAQAAPRSSVVAGVIGYDASNWAKSVSIDKGTSDGIEVGMPVLGTAGVVGQVIAAASGSSRVLLLTDHASGVDALIQGSRARGLVEGLGSATCRWRFVLAGEEVKIGDRVVTSGADGIFPKGLLIGTVSAVDEAGKGLFQSIDVTPAENFLKLETVAVLTSKVPGANK